MSSLLGRLRPARDQVIPLLGLLVALAIHLGGRIMLAVISAMSLWLVAGCVARIIEAKDFPYKPVEAVRALEWRVKLFDASIYILFFAGAFYGIYSVTTSFSSRGFDKFWIGVLSASVAAIAITVLLNPAKDQEWAALQAEKAFNRAYARMFYGLDDTETKLIAIPSQDLARWDPRGVERKAVYEDSYAWEEGKVVVDGWGKAARRDRAKTLAAGLKKDPIEI